MRSVLAMPGLLLLSACAHPFTPVDGGSCLSDRDCPASHPLCDHTHLACVGCLSDASCAAGQSCIASACVVTPPCTSSAACATGVCDIAAGHCVECLAE